VDLNRLRYETEAEDAAEETIERILFRKAVGSKL
jgi:hypothetical protein